MTPSKSAIRLFEGLTDVEREAVGKHLTEKHFEPGEVIFSPGDACLKVFFVRSGRVRLKRASSCGREQTIDTIKAGDSCACHPGGEEMKCASYAEALTPCTVLFMPRDRYADWIQNSPAASRALNQHLSNKLRSLGSLVEDISLNVAQSRLIRQLLKLAIPDDTHKGALTVRASQEEIAREIGVTRETVARQLTTLRTATLIETRHRRITILDKNALKKLL